MGRCRLQAWSCYCILIRQAVPPLISELHFYSLLFRRWEDVLSGQRADVHGTGPSPESSRFREGSTTTRRTDDRPNRRFTRVRRSLRQTGAWCRIVRARDRKSRSLRSPTFRADRGIRSTRGPSQASARSQEDPDRRQGEGSAMHGPVRSRRRLAHASGFGSGDGSIDRAGRGRRAGHSHGGG